MIDELDRQIVASLLRNGRASFRLIAEVLEQQERTIARRAKALLASGLVRIQCFPNPSALGVGDSYMLRVGALPSHLESVCDWIAQCDEVLWVSALSSSNECIVEVFIDSSKVHEFLYGRIASQDGVTNVFLEPIFDYYRTVSGWRPDILTNEQYESLSPIENPQLITQYSITSGAPVDDSKRDLVDFLWSNGRATLEEISIHLGISKPTASRWLESIIADGIVFVRTVLDPKTIGYPVEAFVTIRCSTNNLAEAGRAIAEQPTTRWTANVAGSIQLQGAFRNFAELNAVMHKISNLSGVEGMRMELFSRIYKRSTIVYDQGQLPRQF